MPDTIVMSLIMVWRVLYWAWIATEVLVAFTTYTRSSGGKRSDRGSLRLLWVVIYCSIWAAFSVSAAHPHTLFHGAAWVLPLSVALMIFGLAIRWTAILTLGKSFSVNVAIHTTQTVQKTGIFRFVRHPSYTGMLIIFTALGIRLDNRLALAILLVPTTAALLYRIRVEEMALNEAFGEEYAAYSANTRRLIPGIY